jgi:hypothetical protein
LDRAKKWRRYNKVRSKASKEGQTQGHTLLVVLQEQHVQTKPRKLQIDMLFLDSNPNVLDTAYDYLVAVVKDAAKGLG